LVFKRYGNLGLDIAYDAPPKVSNTQIDLYLNGTVFNASYGEVVPHDTLPDLNVNTSSKYEI